MGRSLAKDHTVAAGVPAACIGELQPTRLPLQKLSIQRAGSCHGDRSTLD